MHKTEVLFSAENPKGAYLETILAKIVDDLQSKTNRIAGLTDAGSKVYVGSNLKIISKLKECIALQEAALLEVGVLSDSKTYTYTYSGVNVEAHPMSWHDYQTFTGNVQYGPEADGMLVTLNKGTINHKSHWISSIAFNNAYRPITE